MWGRTSVGTLTHTSKGTIGYNGKWLSCRRWCDVSTLVVIIKTLHCLPVPPYSVRGMLWSKRKNCWHHTNVTLEYVGHTCLTAYHLGKHPNWNHAFSTDSLLSEPYSSNSRIKEMTFVSNFQGVCKKGFILVAETYTASGADLFSSFGAENGLQCSSASAGSHIFVTLSAKNCLPKRTQHARVLPLASKRCQIMLTPNNLILKRWNSFWKLMRESKSRLMIYGDFMFCFKITPFIKPRFLRGVYYLGIPMDDVGRCFVFFCFPSDISRISSAPCCASTPRERITFHFWPFSSIGLQRSGKISSQSSSIKKKNEDLKLSIYRWLVDM